MPSRTPLASPRRARGRPRLSPLVLWLACASPAFAVQTGTAQPAGPHTPIGDPQLHPGFRFLDNVEGPHIDLGHAPIRPLALAPGDETLFVTNTHDSTIEVFDGASGDLAPEAVYPVPWAPVAIAYWERPGPEPDQLVVSCRGSYALVCLSAEDGTVLDLVEMIDDSGRVLAEPADVLVLGDQAFVACSGADAVAQVDLPSATIARVYAERNAPYGALRMKHPYFLAPDGAGGLYVAPLLSGNNTIAEPGGGIDALERVLNLRTELPGQELPDEDLFHIDPNDGALGSVSVVARATGAVLFAHGVNPETGDYWQLNTEANNADPALQTEPDVRGIFVDNRLTITQPSASPLADYAQHQFIDLDDLVGPGGGSFAHGQPFALTFREGSHRRGTAYVASMLSDRITAIDKDGSAVLTVWDLEDGAIPRGVQLNHAEDRLYVYAFGLNKVYRVDVFDPTAGPLDHHAFELRHDPTPPEVAAGRRLFFDGDNSLEGNISCASCHVDGRTDMLAWNLSAGPGDNKGPMVTQPLVGLEKLTPFHWRGERLLIDFNPAFDGLLGGEALDEEDGTFAAFEAYINFLDNPANPNEALDRELDDTVWFPNSTQGNAILGQDEYISAPIFRDAMTCLECHGLPTGTNNDTFADSAFNEPRRSHRKVAPFHELWRKEMTVVPLDLVPNEDDNENGVIDPEEVELEDYAYLGSGLSHAGLFADLPRFVQAVDGMVERPNVAAFVHQIDQGLAPAVHRSFLLDQDAATDPARAVMDELETYALVEVYDRNASLAVFGEVPAPLGGGTIQARWTYQSSSGKFLPDTPLLAPQGLSAFETQAQSGSWFVFVLLPVGMADRWGIDYDLDEVVNQSDSEPYLPSIHGSDTTPPAFIGVPREKWTSARVSRLYLSTNEPTKVAVEYAHAEEGTRLREFDEFSRDHAVLITDLTPTSPVWADSPNPADPTDPNQIPLPERYQVNVRITDRAGNETWGTVPGTVETTAMTQEKTAGAKVKTGQRLLTDSLEWTYLDEPAPGSLHARARIKVRTMFEAQGSQFVPMRVVVASVLLRDRCTGASRVATTTLPMGSRTFLFDEILAVNPCVPTDDPRTLKASGGPYLVGVETNANGRAAIEFTVDGIGPNEEVVFNIENVIPLHPNTFTGFGCDPTEPNLDPIDWYCNLTGQHAVSGSACYNPSVPAGTLRIPTQQNRNDLRRWSFPDSPVSELVWPVPDGSDPCP